MSEQKQINMAENQLIVGSVKVLGDISGGSVDIIRQQNKDIAQTVAAYNKKQQNFWNDIASDKTISVAEKKTLKREFTQIEQTHTALMQSATEKGIAEIVYIQEYNENFSKLKKYLLNELKVFDDMQNNTNLPDYDSFIAYFENYYESEEYAQAALSGTATATIRTLLSLNEHGTTGELAYYEGVLYRYENGKWKTIEPGNYKGVCNQMPEAKLGNYFLAESDFTGIVTLKTNKGLLKVGGKIFTVHKKFLKGFLYEYTRTGWKVITNKNDYRYLIITNDLIDITGTVSNNLSNFIGNAVDKAEQDALENSERMNYLGICTPETIPENPRLGDFFLYNGVTTEIYKKGSLYKYSYDAATKSNKWADLEPNAPGSYQYYMAALNSMGTEYENASIGVFSSMFCRTIAAQEIFTFMLTTSELFCKTLASQQAFIENLQTKVITLKNGGAIVSENFKSDEGKEEYGGFRIDSEGSVEVYNGIFRGAIRSGPLSIENSNRKDKNFNWNKSTYWLDIMLNLKSNGIYYGTFDINGSFNNKPIKKITISQEIGTKYKTISSKYWYCYESIQFSSYFHASYYTEYHTPYTYSFVITFNDKSTTMLNGKFEYVEYKKEKASYLRIERSNYPQKYELYIPGTLLNHNLNITILGNYKAMKLLDLPISDVILSSEIYEKGTLYIYNGPESADKGTLKIVQ